MLGRMPRRSWNDAEIWGDTSVVLMEALL